MKRKKPVYAESSSDEDTPLASSPAKPSKSNGKVVKQESDADDAYGEESSIPRKSRVSGGRKPPKKKVKEESAAAESSGEDDKPLLSAKSSSRKRKTKSEDSEGVDVAKGNKTRARGKRAKVEDDASGLDIPKPKKKRAGKANDDPTNTSPTKTKGKKKEKKEEEPEEVFRWWEQQDPNGDGTVKWHTLEHNGVIFPPPYESLPSNIKMKYNGMLYSFATSLASFYRSYSRQAGRPSSGIRGSCWFLRCYVGNRSRTRRNLQKKLL